MEAEGERYSLQVYNKELKGFIKEEEDRKVQEREREKKNLLDCKQDWDTQLKVKALKKRLQQEILKLAASKIQEVPSDSVKQGSQQSGSIRRAAEELRMNLLHSQHMKRAHARE